MRNPFSKYLAVLALFGSIACTDLTETPYNQVTEENFNPTAADLAALMTPVYSPLRNMFMSWHGMVDGMEETADALLTPARPNGWLDGGTYIRMHEHKWITGQSQPGNVWNNSFSGINSANRVIYQIESGIIPTDEETALAVTTELKAMRAFYYSVLLDHHARPPIVTDFTDATLPQQATRQQVYEFVVSELTAAIPNLSEETGEAMYGRMNKAAAQAILARVYLNAEVYTGTPQWQKVIDVTGDIIAAGDYRLDATYRGPFARNNQNSPENIFAVPYDQIYARQSNFHMKTLKPELRYVFNLEAQPWGGSASNPQFIDTYDPDDDRLEDTWLMGDQRDELGRGYTFVKHVPAMNAPAPYKNDYHHGFPVRKYEIYAGEDGASEVDYPIVRYAEVLMMRAEALMRLGQPGAGVLVTQVRQRNFKGAAAAKALVTDAQLLEGSRYNYGWYDVDGVVKTGPGGTPVTNGGADIQYGRFLDELGWEFAIEAHRRTDMIRFGVFHTKTWFNHVPHEKGATRNVFPIPSGAIRTNPNLTQNPGY